MAADKISRKEREKKRRREEILLAAQKCFAQNGYHECTMEDIAREYECSVGSLYNFFGGKEEIYRSIFEMHAEKNIDFKEKLLALEVEDPLKSISDYVFARLEFGVANSDFVKMFLRNRVSENFADESLWQENILPTMVSIWDVLENYMEKGVAFGVLRADLDVSYAKRMIEYQIFRVMDEMCLKRCPFSGEELTVEEHWAKVVNIVFNGIIETESRGKSAGLD